MLYALIQQIFVFGHNLRPQREWPIRMGLRMDTEGRWVLLSAVLLNGCAVPEFRCEEDPQCTDGLCESNGFCSLEDDACPSGRRYAPLSGSLSRECVAPGPAANDGGTEPGTSTGVAETSTTQGEDAGSESSGDPQPDLGPKRPSAVEFGDSRAEDFDLGSHAGSTFDDGLRIAGGVISATFVSRVFDAGSADAQWTELRWSPRGPYGKPLPDDGASETHYVEGNADLSANVLLMHMDQAGAQQSGSLIPDHSGQEHDGVIQGGPIQPVAGAPFGAGARVTGGAFIFVSPIGHDDFQFGEDDFTWSLWVRSIEGCRDESGLVTDNQVYMGIEGVSAEFPAHLWLGCSNPAGGSCAGPESGRVGGTFNGVGGGDSFCAAGEHADSQWHHVAVVKRGHAAATVTLWVDGVQRDQFDTAYESAFAFEPSTGLTIGGLSGSFLSSFDVDEAAIYRRGLEDEEVEDLYRRGALTVKLQVRACATQSCGDAEFVGPDGTQESFFVDQTAAGDFGVSLAATSGRFFQYRVVLDGVSTESSPVVDSVLVSALR